MTNASPLARRFAQIKAAVLKSDLTLREKQEICGVPMTTLGAVKKADWNPTIDTLLRLEEAFLKKKGKGKGKND